MIEMTHSLGIDYVVAKNLDVILKEGDDGKRVFKHNGEGEVDSRVSEKVAEAKRKAETSKLPFRIYELFPSEKSVCEQDPLHTLFVSWDGFVSPCINLSYIQNRCFGGRWQSSSIVRFGNIAKEPLGDIWGKREYRDFRGRFRERMDCYSGNLTEFLAPDLTNYKEKGDWPAPPQGCEVCYYLLGV
jgi:MoaA/NifB/PqqE/SkfB family radical SAM enzyme